MIRLTPKEKCTLIVAPVRNGNGVVALKEFAPGEKVFEVRGPRITCDEDDDLDEETRNNAYRFDADFYISPKGTVGDAMNHSCNPNAKVVKIGNSLFVVALRAIPKGREVLIDYSTITGSDDVWTMRCNCGSRRCRGKVKKFTSLPLVLQRRYRALGMVMDHIL